MAGERDRKSGSFRGDLEELLNRLGHEDVMGAGTQGSGRSHAGPKNAARSPAWHNRALFEWRRD